MSRAGFAYAQARLHSRLAGRLSEAEWQLLDGSRDLAHCLDVLARRRDLDFVGELDRRSDAHDIERVLRGGWYRAVDEISAWLPAEWRGAGRWLGLLPHLRRSEFLARGGEAPGWLVAEGEAEARLAAGGAVPLAQRWLTEWERRFPARRIWAEVSVALAPVLNRYLGRQPEGAEGPPAALPGTDLPGHLVRVFRRHAQRPTAAFAYVALLSQDFERLRGVLVARAVFAGAG